MSDFKETYLVTGAKGYLGSQLVKAATSKGSKVVCLIRSRNKGATQPLNSSNIQLVNMDESDWINELTNTHFDAVFHCAAWSTMQYEINDIQEMINSNITLGTILLEICAKKSPPTPLIWAASFAQFSSGTLNYKPNSLYAATKHAFGTICQNYSNNYGVKSIGLVLFDIYGNHDMRNKLLPTIARTILNYKDGEITCPIETTQGEQIVDFLHVDDAVEAFFSAKRLIEKENPAVKGANYFTTCGLNSSPLKPLISELVNCYVDEIDDIIHWGTKAYRKEEIFFPIREPALPGWRAKVDLKKGFHNMMESFRDK